MTEAVPTPIGVVGHYNLLERLEPSGPGELFRARDTRLGRTVTVRVLPAAFVPQAADRSGLLERIQTLKALSHPNVITVFDAGEDDGRIFIAFEHLKGTALRSELAGRQMNVRRAVELAIQIADGVAEAHGAGFVHGGLSPDTVIVTARGHAKIPSFELAAHSGFEEADGSARLRDYDSPEEARGQMPDDRSDIHSVGAVLYEMLTTKRPSHKGAAAPSALNPRVLKELDDIILKAVAPNPDHRYQSVAALAAELRSVTAILDLRDTATDAQPAAAASTSVVRVLIVSVTALAAIGLILWILFSR